MDIASESDILEMILDIFLLLLLLLAVYFIFYSTCEYYSFINDCNLCTHRPVDY